MIYIKLFEEYINEISANSEIKKLVVDWVLGNANFFRFTDDDGKKLVELLQNNLDLKKQSLIDLGSIKFLYRGITDMTPKDFMESLGKKGRVMNEFESFTTSFKIAQQFSGSTRDGFIIRIPMKRISPYILLNIQTLFKDIPKLTKAERRLADEDESNDDLGFRLMLHEQKEVLVKPGYDIYESDFLNNRGEKYQEIGPEKIKSELLTAFEKMQKNLSKQYSVTIKSDFELELNRQDVLIGKIDVKMEIIRNQIFTYLKAVLNENFANKYAEKLASIPNSIITYDDSWHDKHVDKNVKSMFDSLLKIQKSVQKINKKK